MQKLSRASGQATPQRVAAGEDRRAPHRHPSGRPAGLLTPAVLDLDGHGDLLLASDAMTLALRKVLREKRAAGLLR